MNGREIYRNIMTFLIGRGWEKQTSTVKYDLFCPPAELNFSPTYKFYLYNQYDRSHYEKDILKEIDIIAQIYREDIDELVSILIEGRQILTFHIEDEMIRNGRPSIPFFSNLISKSKDLLSEAANFTVLQKQHFFDKQEEAERYLNHCNFFKNDVGSLITKIQLPNQEEIKQGTLFEKAIRGHQINEKLIEVTSFVNDQILDKANFQPEDDFLLEHQNLISINVTNSLKNLYHSIDYVDMEVALKGITTQQVAKARNLNKEKVTQLNTFSQTVREKMKEISNHEVYGKIVKLQSKNVEEDENKVTIEGMIRNIKSNITVQLTSQQLQEATEAFKNNKQVMIKARLEKRKSQYRVETLSRFQVL